MKNSRILVMTIPAVAIVVAITVTMVHAKENVLLRFNFTNGSEPQNALITDGQGNLYGTALGGNNCPNSTYGCGIVYELSPGSGGEVTEKILYAFTGNADGSAPSGLAFGKDGNLYGTIFSSPDGVGGVFQLKRGRNGKWTETIIYSFNSRIGYYPGNQLAFDASGNLYDCLLYGGSADDGLVFELSPHANGTWTVSTIYSFVGGPNDGSRPFGGVVVDSKGNVYGTTENGGRFNNDGTVYELSPSGNGTWTETILYNFTGRNDGGYPLSPLTMDGSGNLYGTTTFGGANGGGGTAFELSLTNNAWIETTLYSFNSGAADGFQASGLALDGKGNIYGTTLSGGNGCNLPGCGIVFRLTPQSGQPWKETILHEFQSAGDGSEADRQILSAPAPFLDKTSGKLYGVTPYGGGMFGYGTVFEIEP
jgi:uncharacterized repeat protein (TIGR03803 family)